MEKAFQIQKQARDNAQSFQTYLTDLRNWEYEMKRKEAALNSEVEQELPPVRSKVRKEKPMVEPKPQEKRISASDYKAWEKFDVDQALEEVDMADKGPTSLDSKKSEADKKGKLREEALLEKEKGNQFVRECRWDDAIGCYNRAIELVNNDAVYYANRALCYLKKERFRQAESDCTESIKLDSTYVKAYQRRAAAREMIGSFVPASKDLEQVLKLEPHNKSAAKQLQEIKSKIKSTGEKKDKSRSASAKNSPMPSTSKQAVLPESSKPKDKHYKWKNGVGENICIIQPAVIPPHLRSKKPLISVPIKEAKLGELSKSKKFQNKLIGKPVDEANNSELAKTLESNKDEHGDEKVETLESNKDEHSGKMETQESNKDEHGEKMETLESKKSEQDEKVETPESNKLIAELKTKEKKIINYEKLVAPNSSFQFLTDWKSMDGNLEARAYYLDLIEPEKIPDIFGNCLESDTLSEIIGVIHDCREKFKLKLKNYLLYLSKVKRFGALAMFMTLQDKDYVRDILFTCQIDDQKELDELLVLYELEYRK